jgi:hypothetical protein
MMRANYARQMRFSGNNCAGHLFVSQINDIFNVGMLIALGIGSTVRQRVYVVLSGSINNNY